MVSIRRIKKTEKKKTEKKNILKKWQLQWVSII